jgi:malonyl-CoA/methylmalonyl-CoA synthetase
MTEKAVASFLEEDGGFPDDKIFNTLLPIARELDHIVFNDPAKDINANYDQLITDVIHMRHKLREQLSRFLDPQNKSIFTESVLICTLAPANYEYAVATFAILALGGTVVPLRM